MDNGTQGDAFSNDAVDSSTAPAADVAVDAVTAPAEDSAAEPTSSESAATAADAVDGDDAVVADAVAAAPASRRGALLALGGIVVVLAVFFVVAFAPKGAPVGGALPGDPTGYAMPDATLQKLDGSGALTLSSLKGRPVVINFWASWCEPCKDEAALLGATEKVWRDKGVVFIGFDSEDKTANALKFEQTYGLDYTSVVNPNGAENATWGVTGYPETFFIGRDGRIVSKFISSIDKATLESSLAAITAS